MKKIILAITVTALFAVGCSKSNKLENQCGTNNSNQNLQSRVTDESDYLEYKFETYIYNEQKTDSIEAVISANTQAELDNYLHSTLIYFKNIDFTPPSPSEAPNGELSESNTDSLIRITLFDEDRAGTRGYTLFTKSKDRSGYTYKEEWDSQCDYTQINWIYTNNNNNDLKVKVEYKNCAFCWTRYDLVNTFMGSYFTQANYYKSSKRLYVTIWNNWKNRSVTFY